MSIWYEIEDKEFVSLSTDEKTIEILYKADDQGNHYVDVPIKFIIPLLTDLIK